jgi:hypothetical protein
MVQRPQNNKIMGFFAKLFGGSKGGSKAAARPAGKPIGEVTHYYDKAGVAVVKFNKDIAVGTRVKFMGATTDFEESLGSMEFDHASIQTAPKGQEVGVKVSDKVREGDSVYAA